MRHHRTPCGSCPYRRDQPLAVWAEENFVAVKKGEASTMGSVFACHGDARRPPDQRSVCAGFLIDQRERGVPSISLRIHICDDDDLAAAIREASSPVEMMTAKEMCDANLEAIASGALCPPEAAERVEALLLKRQR